MVLSESEQLRFNLAKSKLERKRQLLELDRLEKQASGSKQLLRDKAIRSRNVRIARPMPQQEYSSGQNVLREIFRGEQTFGTGQNLPNTDEQMLRKGGGLIKNGDFSRRTARMFGLR